MASGGLVIEGLRKIIEVFRGHSSLTAVLENIESVCTRVEAMGVERLFYLTPLVERGVPQ
jgi:hypothetical protein